MAKGSVVKRGLGIAVGVVLASTVGTSTPAEAQSEVLRDGRVYVPLSVVSQVAAAPQFGGRPPFDESIRGFFEASNFFVGGDRFGGLIDAPAREFETFLRAGQSVVDRVPIPSGAASAVYRYDTNLETWVAADRPFTPAIAQIATTNGEGILTFGVAHSYLDYRELDGRNHRNVPLPIFNDVQPNPGNLGPDPGVDFVGQLDFQLKQQVVGFSFSYGVLENLDLGVLVPLIDVDFRGRLLSRFFGVTEDGRYRPLRFRTSEEGEFGLVADERLQALFAGRNEIENVAFAAGAVTRPGENPLDVAANRGLIGVQHRESQTGVGDVVLRSRYHAMQAGPANLGFVLNVTAPTGDSDNLLGVDAWRADPRLIASAVHGRTAVHANFGYHVDFDDNDRDRIDYFVGGEVLVFPWLTLLFDHIGFLEVRGDTKIREFDIVPGVKATVEGLLGTIPGMEGMMGTGAETAVFRTLIVGFNAIIPVNEEGLMTEFTPNVSVSSEFSL